jgi:two-component system sensor histidine kinase/response regulator
LTAAINRLGLRMQQRSAVSLERASLARKAEARQVEFIELVSRSLRTPLHSIIGFSELLAEGLEGPLLEGQQEDVHSIHRSGHHLLSLVDDLVDYTRLEGGYLALSTEAVDLAEVAVQALDAASGLRRDKSIELESKVDSDLPKIEADPTRLRQILINLIGNAIKFTDRGSVQVSASLDEPGWLRVKVSDQGPGIPHESLGRVFGEFETVRSTRASSPIKGTGLGLAITRRLVELHGGQISVQNQPTGGAEFCFTLPLHRFGEPSA